MMADLKVLLKQILIMLIATPLLNDTKRCSYKQVHVLLNFQLLIEDVIKRY